MQYSNNTNDFKVFYLFEDGSQVCFWVGWRSLPDNRIFNNYTNSVQNMSGHSGRIVGYKVMRFTEEEHKIIGDGRVQSFVNRTIFKQLPDDGTITLKGMLELVGYDEDRLNKSGNGLS